MKLNFILNNQDFVCIWYLRLLLTVPLSHTTEAETRILLIEPLVMDQNQLDKNSDQYIASAK